MPEEEEEEEAGGGGGGGEMWVFPTAFKVCPFCNSKHKNSPSSIAKQHPSASFPLPLSGLIQNKAPNYH